MSSGCQPLYISVLADDPQYIISILAVNHLYMSFGSQPQYISLQAANPLYLNLLAVNHLLSLFAVNPLYTVTQLQLLQLQLLRPVEYKYKSYVTRNVTTNRP